MNKFADECINNKFENVWDTADALVFTITTIQPLALLLLLLYQ